MSHSIAFLKFKKTIELEIRSFWHLLSALEISDREVIKYKSPLITGEPGNSGYPFKAISIAPRDYVKESKIIAGHVRENSLVNFITIFESYLFEIMERIIYLNPGSISDSEINLTAGDIVSSIRSSDPKKWISRKVADKYLRNKTHAEMIKKFDKISKLGISKSKEADIDEWGKWALVRNSVVHTARKVTMELSEKWPQKYPSAGDAFNLKNEDVSRVFSLAISIAQSIDSIAVRKIIKKSDALVFAREIYVHYGISGISDLRNIISGCGIRIKLTNEDLAKMLSRHKKGLDDDSLTLSSAEIKMIFPEELALRR